MRATILLALAACALAAPNPQTSSAGCSDKCSEYDTWMSSCAGYEPSGSGWSSACTEYCTSSKKKKAYTDCAQCKASSGMGGGDNGSLDRLCNQLVALNKIPSSATSASKAEKTDKKSGAATNSVAVGSVALAAVGALLF